MDGKVVVITGAGSGIGRLAALAFAARGARVVLVGRRESALSDVAAAIGNDTHCLLHAADLRKPVAATELIEALVARFGRIDILFNNAGTFDGPVPIDEVTPEQWQSSIDINLSGAFFCAQAAFRAMKRQMPQGGRIINNGSVSSQVPRPNAVAYSASKSAITGLTRAISLEGRAFGITCGQVDIGNASTDMTSGMAKGMIQPDGTVRPEPTMSAANAVDAVLFMAGLPPEANVPHLTVVASAMPFGGRG
ncbi:SDR family oxidoreductase [Shinella sp.]|uniref:SDR family oxidoreductase n=1 Tax=Shinella sp. TaxID=1870904 RepID=UPI003F711BEB